MPLSIKQTFFFLLGFVALPFYIYSIHSSIDSLAARYAALGCAELHLARGDTKQALQNLGSVFSQGGGSAFGKSTLWRVLDRSKQYNMLASQENDVQDDVELQTLYIQALVRVNNEKKAIELLNELLVKFPEENGLVMLAASVYAGLGELDQAIAIIDRYLGVATCARQEAQWYLIKAKLYEQQGNISAAIDALTHVLSIRSGLEKVFLMRALLYEQERNYEAALKDYRSYMDIGGHDATIHKHVIALLFSLGRYEQAQEMLHSRPEQTASYWFDCALLAWKMRDSSAALKYLKSVEQEDPLCTAAYLLKLQILLAAKETSQALAIVQSWLDQSYDDSEPYEAAMLLFSAGISCSELVSTLTNTKAHAYPNSLLRATLADLYTCQSDWSHAQDYCKPLALFAHSKDVRLAARYMYAHHCFVRQDYPELELYLQNYLCGEYESAPSENLRAYYYAMVGKNAQAEPIIDLLVRANPKTAAYHNTKGFVCLKKGDVSAAKSSFEQALSCDPSNPIIAEHKALAH